VVINNFNIESIAFTPMEADSPLIINSYTMLSSTFPAKYLQTIGRWYTQIIKRPGVVNHTKLSPGYLLDLLGQSSRALSVPDLFGFLCPKTLNH